MYPSLLASGNVTPLSSYCATNFPSPSPNVYSVPSKLPSPSSFHSVNTFSDVKLSGELPPLPSNVILFPSGGKTAPMSIVEL